MDDSGVGIKNGVNRFGLKNFYGTFQSPYAVINDFNFLETLSDRIWVSGIAEAFKVGIIKDAKFLDFLIENSHSIKQRDKGVEESIVLRTAELHMNHISESGDPIENGSSRPLDFGHWLAHKLESMTKFQLLHGEAVAIGIAVDLYYASQLGFISQSEAKQVCSSMKKIELPIFHPFLTGRFKELFVGLQEFREHLGGALTVAMPRPFGSIFNINEMDSSLLRQAISHLSKAAQSQPNF